MLHSLLILNEENYVLLARYFDPALTLDARKRFEAQLARICTQQLPNAWAKTPPTATPTDQLLVCENQFVVLRAIGELRVMLAGNEEYDELILSELLGVLHAALIAQLEKKLTEASLLANYAKVVAAIDELVQHSHAETTDENTIEQMSKLKPFPIKY